MRAALLGGVLLTVFALTGCGSDDETAATDGTSSSADDSIVVVAEDIAFPETAFEAVAGEVQVQYRNDGSIAHTLLIEDVDGFKLEVASNGDVDDGSVELQAGSYTLYCDVAGHREAGMEATLDVN